MTEKCRNLDYREKFPDHMTVKLWNFYSQNIKNFFWNFSETSILPWPALENQAHLNAKEEGGGLRIPSRAIILHSQHTLYIHMASQLAKKNKSTE